ncbi:hypothetical protein AAFF_G00051630 [Aldrovandia affinis]|uniref:Uncharacterized protein n=1 Tax=Aldrovandia affinis TaxID=143900 RepID=A0AAD7T4Q5_9TELE|nr:hypothetical protein AAFF_G00051630 [Aldrovandia affinis]
MTKELTEAYGRRDTPVHLQGVGDLSRVLTSVTASMESQALLSCKESRAGRLHGTRAALSLTGSARPSAAAVSCAFPASV